MSHATTQLKKDIQKTLADLHTLRDELRVKAHLAGMDAKDEWAKIEDELEAGRARGGESVRRRARCADANGGEATQAARRLIFYLLGSMKPDLSPVGPLWQ